MRVMEIGVPFLYYAKARNKLLDWLRQQLVGPADSIEEILREITPLERYSCGVLFPIIKGESEGIDPASISDELGGDSNSSDTSGTQEAEPAAQPRRYTPPSSVGFSFYICGENIQFQVLCDAAVYKCSDDRDEEGRYKPSEYQRIVLGGDAEAIEVAAPRHAQPKVHRDRFDRLYDGQSARAGLDVLWRPYKGGWIVTVSLFNKQELFDTQNFNRLRNEQSLFQVSLKCVFEDGLVGDYPRVNKSLLSDEEEEIEVQYAHKQIYAVGHGAAVDWSVDARGTVQTIRSDFLPTVEVPQVTADIGKEYDDVLKLASWSRFANTSRDSNDLLRQLDGFVKVYESWISERQEDARAKAEDEQAAAGRILGRMKMALERMERGLALLRRDILVRKAFSVANQAILRQMMQSDKNRGKEREVEEYRWRPFQLAFLLTVIESSIEEDDEFRDIVDLIWFPTGGGKTEAYLGLIAFLIAWRRFKFNSSGGGTAVLMRYTLRLLTAQQYLRATRMICAMELMRREDASLGREPISVGIWVGAASSPNRFVDALKILHSARSGRVGELKKFILDSCPWCGTPFDAHTGFMASETRFGFRCRNDACEFGGERDEDLPCNVVDEALYKHPPTLLLGTIDKFARLAWDDRPGAFFGQQHNRPPELVIQDELHLIAGALGSIAGLYEAALDTVLRRRGVNPKYVASTATIRMADDQVLRLYGRDLAVFPPPGLSSEDSFFARTVSTDEKSGRLYLGYMAPLLSRAHCMAPLAAALQVAPEVVFDKGTQDRDDLLEAWWTLIVYHGSLRGVGNSHNAFNIDVRELADRLIKEICQQRIHKGEKACTPEEQGAIVSRQRVRIEQLTSQKTAEENAQTFARLEKPRTNQECVDVALATNMIAVGLDVSRLALMVVNGQPLTTAEYIQASSRVGRSDVPGLVVTNYYRDQARSLSHYENFRPYHESFYRFVEPTSVTPFTYQARRRALHAALVIALRHSCDFLRDNDAAGEFDPSNNCVRQVIDELKARCRSADPERADETSIHLDALVKAWYQESRRCKALRVGLAYQVPSKDKVKERLLYTYDDKFTGLWVTLNSMRNVENTAVLESS